MFATRTSRTTREGACAPHFQNCNVNVWSSFRRSKPVRNSSASNPERVRGWTLDVLTAIRSLFWEGRAPRDPNISDKSGRRGTPPSDTFTNGDAYTLADQLAQLHPDDSESFRSGREIFTEGNKRNKDRPSASSNPSYREFHSSRETGRSKMDSTCRTSIRTCGTEYSELVGIVWRCSRKTMN